MQRQKSGDFFLRTQDQVVLMKHEFLGQISDGMWENARPEDHAGAWCVADIKVAAESKSVGRTFYARKDNYNLVSKELLDIVGNRARLCVKIARAFSEENVDALRHLFDEDDVDHPFKGKLPDYIATAQSGWGVDIKNKIEALSLEHGGLIRIGNIVNAQTYIHKDLLKDLREIKAAMKVFLTDPMPSVVRPEDVPQLSTKKNLDNDSVFVGTFVRTLRNGYVGRVYQKHALFSETTAGEAWFNNQTPKLDPELKNHPWVGILVKGGGSVLVPISDCVKTDIYRLGNTWEKFYFEPNRIVS